LSDLLALQHLEMRNCGAPPDTALAALGVGFLGAIFASAPAFYPDPTGWTQRPWHLEFGAACFALGALRASSIWRSEAPGEPTPVELQQFFRFKFITLALIMVLGATSITIGAFRWADFWGKLYTTTLMLQVSVLIPFSDAVLFKYYAAQESANAMPSLRTASLGMGVFYLVILALMHFDVLPPAPPLIAIWISASLGLGWVFTRLAVIFTMRLVLFYAT